MSKIVIVHEEHVVPPSSFCVLSPRETDKRRRDEFDEMVDRGFASITSPDDPLLERFHSELLIPYLGEEVVEPLSILAREIASTQIGGRPVRFLCLVLKDLSDEGAIASGTYASVQDGVLAKRFTVTREKYCGTGITERINALLLQEAVSVCKTMGTPLRSCFAECVTSAEEYVNRIVDPPLCRVYVAQDNGFCEMHYELPHLGEWDAHTGEPADPVSDTESIHLHLSDLSAVGEARTLTVNRVEEVLTSVWKTWYLKDRVRFATDAAWERHRQLLMDETLVGQILSPLRLAGLLRLLTRTERMQLERSGCIFAAHEVH
ncbi:MAG: hypothetical protein HZA46_07550 [Planctomycetales bacterium]|nr:hypothetical protein [Planctomycetales bacterium]